MLLDVGCCEVQFVSVSVYSYSANVIVDSAVTHK